MKNVTKKVRLVFLGLALTIFLTGYSVFAVDDIKFCDTNDTSANIVQRYKIKVTNTSGDNYTISMSDGCDEKVSFAVQDVNGDKNHAAVGKEVSCDKPLSFSATSSYDNDFGLPGVSVNLKSTGPVIAYKEEQNSCYWQSVIADVYTTAGGSEETTTVQYEHGELIDISGVDSVIDCDNNTYRKNGKTNPIVAGSFEDKFCNAKRKAIAAGNNRDFGTGKYTGDPANFKCDYRIENVPLVTDELEGDAYFVNKSYLYGTTKLSKEATIIHHYYPSAPEKITKEKLTCEIECQEAVEVEYGPPVASAAGVCFEYNVRATSRVACNMTKIPPTTTLCETKYCTPYPQCKHSGGTIYTQAGPSEQYDACIKSCDGGKYTQQCANTCYKQIYGFASAAAKVNATTDVAATKVKTDYTKGQCGDNFDCNGYYDKNSKEIVWVGGDSAGRWYCDYGWKDRELSYRIKFFTDGAGFFRKEFSAGSLCSADCYWTQCEGKVYLNQKVPCDKVSGLSASDKEKYCKNGQIDILKYDCDKNTETYNQFIQECMSKASCSTTTAEFTISTEYTKLGKTTATVLNFPYDNQKDTITNNGSATITTADQKNSTLLVDYPTEGIGLLGCYNGLNQKDLYRATWGFPSSWMNIKTGEVSYNPSGKTTTTGSGTNIWYEHKHRFCIPGDAAGVNVLWYNAYMHRILAQKRIARTSATVVTNCGYDSQYSITSEAIESLITSENSVKYNIHAKARQFGFLEWDIDVDCFYAINEDPVCKTYQNDKCITTNEVKSKCLSEGYRVHTVDNTNMFPNENGEALRDTTKSGREFVGYNWSEFAINNKNVNYSSNPPAYMAKIQGAGKGIYDESNLDYEFYLSPKTIREMRKQVTGGSSANYTAFSDSGFSTDKNSISRYRSDKIHGSSSVIPAEDKKVPSEKSAAITCNNMINWQTTDSCDPVHNS